MTRNRVVVTGLGCVSPLGNDVETTWSAVRAGRSGAGPITTIDAQGLKTQFAAEVKDFDPEELLGRRLARRTDRFTQFALVATEEAINHAGLKVDEHMGARVGVVMGTGIGGIGTLVRENDTYHQRGARRVSPFMVPMMLPDSAAGQLAIRFGLRGPNMAVVTACASGSNSIGEATETIRRDSADVMIAGGTEAAIIPIAMAGFNIMDAISTRNDDPLTASRPFDLDRDGFVVAEGAASLVLESYQHARNRGATIMAEISGYSANNDAFHISAPAENGAGAATCMKLALEDAGLHKEQIDYINAHGTSTPLNDASETSAIKSVFGDYAYEVPVSSTKSMTGHLMGAGGALEALLCVKAIQDSFIPATINYTTPDPECDLDYVPNRPRQKVLIHVLKNSFGFGGHNACLIVSKLTENETVA
ncbi:MAG: beta-ketoacyl-ACP synthase II [Anaerolineales bacterium]|nr:beta-ketoacyl-ACP synthase II [Anaerolineales bacterium]